jgi:integration host factor subunit alpha
MGTHFYILFADFNIASYNHKGYNDQTRLVKKQGWKDMATVTRIDFANRLRERFGLTTADAAKLVDVIFDEIREALINGEDVKFAGFGTFKILTKSARMGRNPKTGAPAVISARRVATFRPSNEFRARVASGK